MSTGVEVDMAISDHGVEWHVSQPPRDGIPSDHDGGFSTNAELGITDDMSHDERADKVLQRLRANGLIT